MSSIHAGVQNGGVHHDIIQKCRDCHILNQKVVQCKSMCLRTRGDLTYTVPTGPLATKVI